MMNDKEILEGAPEGATHVDIDNHNYFYLKVSADGNWWTWNNVLNIWHVGNRLELLEFDNIRFLADIRALVEKDERIKELEKALRDSSIVLGGKITELEKELEKEHLSQGQSLTYFNAISEVFPELPHVSVGLRGIRVALENLLKLKSLEQQALGAKNLRESTGFWDDSNCQLRTHARNFELHLLEQAKQLREGEE